jgi:pyridine nucleotide-disulfide oxidoreductase family protein
MKQLLLVGAGHAHAQVLLDLAQSPLPGVQVTVVSPEHLAPYSGMVPGWLAGYYTFNDIVIDFAKLCAAAGARWVCAAVDALDTTQQRLHLTNGETLTYDIVSFNVGSTLHPPEIDGLQVLALRPLSNLRCGYESLLARWKMDAEMETKLNDFTVTAVGAGAAGFESLLAIVHRLRVLNPRRNVLGRLVSRGATLLPGVSGMARRAAAAALADARIQVQFNTEWAQPEPGFTSQGGLILWATGAQAHTWQTDPDRRGDLCVSAHGFIRVDEQLRSVSHPHVFAVGDCCEWTTPLPKAGVYAVRMGPVLTHNLRAALGAGANQSYTPQRQFLALLATGDGHAIASRGLLGAKGRWVWRWKDHIDRSFIRRFVELEN